MRQYSDRAIVVLCVGPCQNTNPYNRIAVITQKVKKKPLRFSLPSGRVSQGEDLATAASRVLQRETTITLPPYVFSEMSRRLRRETYSPHMSHLFVCEATLDQLPRNGLYIRSEKIRVVHMNLKELIREDDFLELHRSMILEARTNVAE